MQYQTIVLELLKQRPNLHHQLRQQRQLLPVMQQLARELKASHEAWLEAYSTSSPNSESLNSQAAFEQAIQELEARLDSDSPPDGTETFQLDQAMAFARKNSATE
jgi:hypothetical protein